MKVARKLSIANWLPVVMTRQGTLLVIYCLHPEAGEEADSWDMAKFILYLLDKLNF
jgi:hypothetical protein